MKQPFLLLFYSFILFSCSNNNDKATGDIPTREDVTAAMKKAYENTTTAGDVFGIEINDIKIGHSQIANTGQELEGIIKGTTVTDVEVAYDITGHIQSHKISNLWMYKNEFDEWKFKTAAN